MPGKWITGQQVRLYMTMRKQGDKQITASARAGISERSGRRLETSGYETKKVRNWRTRPDPLSDVWEQEIVPQLRLNPQLQAITVLEYLQEKYKDDARESRYGDNILRTLQRRIRNWKAIEGPAQEVMFEQRHEPGRLGLSDFTTLKTVAITIKGKPFAHRFYHFRLAYSHWSYLRVVQGGESFTALAEGLQDALWRLGGSPHIHRTDSLSAALLSAAL